MLMPVLTFNPFTDGSFKAEFREKSNADKVSLFPNKKKFTANKRQQSKKARRKQ